MIDIDRAQLLQIREVREMLGNVSAMFVWRNTKAGNFPAPIKLGQGPRARRFWRRSDIVNWIEQRSRAA